MARDGAADNYGFKRVEVLPGNVGYIRLDRFHPAAEGGEAALAEVEIAAPAGVSSSALSNTSARMPSPFALAAAVAGADEDRRAREPAVEAERPD